MKQTTTNKLAAACAKLSKRVDRYIQDWALEMALETYSECRYVSRWSEEDANYAAMRVRYRIMCKELRSDIRSCREMLKQEKQYEADMAKYGVPCDEIPQMW